MRTLAICSVKKRHPVAREESGVVYYSAAVVGLAHRAGHEQRTNQSNDGVLWLPITQADFDARTELDASGQRHSPFGATEVRCHGCNANYDLTVDEVFATASAPNAPAIIARKI